MERDYNRHKTNPSLFNKWPESIDLLSCQIIFVSQYFQVSGRFSTACSLRIKQMIVTVASDKLMVSPASGAVHGCGRGHVLPLLLVVIVPKGLGILQELCEYFLLIGFYLFFSDLFLNEYVSILAYMSPFLTLI